MPQLGAAPADQQQRRSDELDAREAYLTAREKIAGQTETAITKGQYELSLLDATILARETIVAEQQDRMLSLDKEYARKQTILEHAILKKQESYAKWGLKLVELQTTASSIKKSIAERQDYYREQEGLITKQAEDGNLQLRGLEYAIIEAKQIIRDSEVKKQNLYSEQKALEDDLQGARDSFGPEIAAHEAEITAVIRRKTDSEAEVITIQGKVDTLTKEVKGLLVKRQQIHTDVDAKLQILDTKEREIMTKREALRQEQETMEEAKHYYRDPKSLYGTI